MPMDLTCGTRSDPGKRPDHPGTDCTLQSPECSNMGYLVCVLEPIMTPSRWQEIERIHAAALERPLEERDAFLRQACGDDASLRRIVESLFECRTGDGLHGLPALRIDDLLPHNAETLRAGKQLGPY